MGDAEPHPYMRNVSYIAWHLRKAWAPLTFTDETPPARTDAVLPARRSASATAKVSTRADDQGRPVRSFTGVLDHLGTLTRNTTRIAGTTIDILATPTTLQRRAFELIGTAIPITIT